MTKDYFLGIELGSTRIKAVAVDENHIPVASGDYTWKSTYENGIWTYDLAEVWQGLKAALSGMENRENIAAMGISGMMHGYLAFDKDNNLLAPFRTWRNTITAKAAEELSALFDFNIPQRWSIAHLYQAILNGEEHAFEGRVDGRIATSRSGSAGFGYDPIFIPQGYEVTFAEMSADDKNAISHRGRAMQKLIDHLRQSQSI